MRIVLATIPHTGTNFFMGLLAQHFPLVTCADLVEGRHGFWPLHVSTPNFARMQRIARPVVITTVRDPEKVRRSWEQRGQVMRMLDEAYEQHAWMMERWHPIVVSIDDDREARLEALEQKLGVRFETDWAPVNAWSKT